ncbi:sugar kinase [Halovulum sp. GXIMD14793]
MTTPLFLAIGECMVELTPTEDGTFQRGFAGDTFNTAWYAQRLLAGWRVGYCSCVGADPASEAMLQFMTNQGIETQAIRRDPARSVGLYMIELENGERSFSYWRSASAARQLAADKGWLQDAIKDASALHFSGITLAILPEADRATFLDVIRTARAAGVTTIFDTNQRPRLWPNTSVMCAALSEAATCASIVLPSFDEEQAGFGDADPAATVARYRQAGAKTVIVKNGAGPMTGWSEADDIVVLDPPRITDVVDSTAAGDSFNAGALAALLTGQGLKAAMQQGADLAARAVQGRGALVELWQDQNTPGHG